MDRTRLARDLVRTSLAFHDRALWRGIRGEQMFAVRVGDAPAMLASVLGHAGRVFGLTLHRGPDALRHVREIESGRPLRDILGPHDFLSLTFDPPSEVPEEFAGVLREAKFSGRIAPCVRAKDPGKRVRPPRPAESELLLRVLKGVLAAADRGLLRPASLPRTGPAPVWTLTLGEGDEPLARARFERLEDQVPVPAQGPVLLPGDLRELPRTDAHWLVAAPTAPAHVAGEERMLHTALVVDAGRMKILRLVPMLGVDTAQVASELFDACRGRNALDSEGLPARVDFGSEELHAALAPALAELNIETRLEPALPIVQRIMDGFHAHLRAEVAGPDPHAAVPEAGDLEGWKRLDIATSARIFELVEGSSLGRREADRYFGPAPTIDAEDSEAAMSALFDWFVFHHRGGGHKKTLVERVLAARSLPAGLHAVLEARAAGATSLYRIAGIERGVGVDLADVLSGASVRVHDRAMAETATVDTMLFARVYRAGAFHFAVLLSAPLPPDEQLLQWLEDQGLKLTPAGLAAAPHLLGRVWSWRAERRRTPPRLVNTDGEPTLEIRASFAVADVEALRAALRRRPDVEEDDEGMAWLRPKPGGEFTLLARLEFVGDELVATVNSEGRLERLGEWLLALPGVTAGEVTRREVTAPTSADDRGPLAAPAEPLPPEMLQAVREHLRRRAFSWLDEPIPALGGKTPRQAVRTPDGRRRVVRLIRTMPDPMGPGGPIQGATPRAELLRELGLAEGEAGG